MISNDELKKFQRVIEGPLESLALSLYPEYMATYQRFRKAVGPQCAYCKSAAKTIYAFEMKRKGDDFIERFKNGNWSDYK